MFGKGMDLRKWAGTVTDLIDVRKKVRMFYIKSKIFCIVVIFLFE
jgi:hypothetical protein